MLGYPLIMVVSALLFAWSLFSALRGTLSTAISLYEQLIGVGLLLIGFLLYGVVGVIANRRSNQVPMKSTVADRFNATLIHEVIHVHLDAPSGEVSTVRPGDITSAGLVGRDNSLALAKVRLDLEQALRELARTQAVEVIRTESGARKMAERLAEGDVLPAELVEPIRQIIDVCNQAIHGSEVSDELADAVVSVSEELLARLRWLAETRTDIPHVTTMPGQ